MGSFHLIVLLVDCNLVMQFESVGSKSQHNLVSAHVHFVMSKRVLLLARLFDYLHSLVIVGYLDVVILHISSPDTLEGLLDGISEIFTVEDVPYAL